MEANNFFGDYFFLLPPELQLHVFSFLPKDERVVDALVSKTFMKLCRDNSLWKEPLAQLNCEIKEMFPQIPHKKNHIKQWLTNHRYLESRGSDEVQSKMEAESKQGHLGHVKALCYHGYMPNPFTLSAAVRANKEEVIKFIKGNYHEKIENDLKLDLKNANHVMARAIVEQNIIAFNLAAKIVRDGILPAASSH